MDSTFTIYFIIIILVSIPAVLILQEKLMSRKYKFGNDIPNSFKWEEDVKQAVLIVLTSWNNENLDEEIKVYSNNLLKLHLKHIHKNMSKQVIECFKDIKIDGLNNYKRSKSKFTIEVSLTLNYKYFKEENSDNNFILWLPSSAQYTHSLVPEILNYSSKKTIVQKWWFIVENEKIKAYKFK